MEKILVTLYKYGMRLRGFSLGCQPRENLYKRIDDTTNKYYDIIIYTQPLTLQQTISYELDYLGEGKT